MRHSVFFAWVLFLFLICCTACTPKDEGVNRTIFAMDTVMTFTVYGDRAQEAIDAACTRIFELDDLLSVTKENSEIARLNAANGMPISVSPEVYGLIRTAKAYSEHFAGFFDITIASVVDLWGFYTDDYTIPSSSEIENALNTVDYRFIELEDATYTVTLKNGAQLDLGAIAKGYATEQIRLIFSKYDIQRAVVNLGGNVFVLGTKPDHTEWLVAVRSPFQTNGQLGVLGVTDCVLVTSGSYQRYFEENGICYHHIMDPKTGKPAESDLLSVTIVSDDAVYADVLSTSLFVMGYEKALEYWESSSDFEAIFVFASGEVVGTPGIMELLREQTIPFLSSENVS